MAIFSQLRYGAVKQQQQQESQGKPAGNAVLAAILFHQQALWHFHIPKN